MREIVVYRHNLFKVSEPFVLQQASRLRRFRPVYLGRLRYGPPPPGAASLALSDFEGWGWIPRLLRQVITRDPGSYLRLLQGRRPVLIHAHFGIEGVYAVPMARRLKVPLITTFHGFDATLSTAAMLGSPVWAHYPLHRKQLAREGALFLCASSFIRDQLLAAGFPDGRTKVHYIGVDTASIEPREGPAASPLILHVARLVEVKGTEYLIRAFADVAHRVRGAELVILGDGPRRHRLRKLAAKLGVPDRIRFLGARPHSEVIDWMRRAAVLVLPSVRTRTGRAEGLGLVLLEAAASGIPAIGTRCGGIPEAIIDGETGVLVPERDWRALAAELTRLLEDPALQAVMGRQARAMAETRFDLGRQTDRLEALYEEVIEKHERGR